MVELVRFDEGWRVRFASLFQELDGQAMNIATRAGSTEDELLAALTDRIAARLGLGPPRPWRGAGRIERWVASPSSPGEENRIR